ncbi:MAG: YceI family protein [Crocinitomicaceae bacterium]|nr:YceI family protein [Crocinitomicaceae bacterium]
MKRFGTILMASTALFAASCSSNEEKQEQDEIAVAESIAYNLDASETTLLWAANMGPDYGHNGSISITEGTMTMTEDKVESGSFTIDMNSIKSIDLMEAGEEDKAGYLEGHLKGTMVDENHPADLFFNSPVFPTTKVSLGEYKDGMLNLTISMLGKEISQEVAADISHDNDGAAISGEFQLDLTSLEIPGLQPNPEDGSQINPIIDFKLNAVMTK